MNYVIHKPVEKVMYLLPERVLYLLVFVLTIYFVCDFSLSFKEALDFKDVLMRMERVRAEVQKMQKRLDVVIAVAEDDWNTRKEEIEESIEVTRGKIGTEKRNHIYGIFD